jgi:hypothetical protein
VDNGLKLLSFGFHKYVFKHLEEGSLPTHVQDSAEMWLYEFLVYAEHPGLISSCSVLPRVNTSLSSFWTRFKQAGWTYHRDGPGHGPETRLPPLAYAKQTNR